MVIDIGNTFTKVAFFDDDNLLFTNHYNLVDTALVDELLNQYHVDSVIISSVKKDKEQWQLALGQKTKLTHFSAAMATGIRNHYLTPGTLGLDRLAAVIGAQRLFAGSNNLVIDGGTCITYDHVDHAGNYFGGSITPGLSMRYSALNYFTAGLPLVDMEEGFDKPNGEDTITSIRSGVQNGIKYELTGCIESYIKKDRQLNVILTGGDCYFFDTLLKNSIFAPYIKIEPYLVLKGLNAAIQQQYND